MAAVVPGLRKLLPMVHQELQQGGGAPDETHLHTETPRMDRGGRGGIRTAVYYSDPMRHLNSLQVRWALFLGRFRITLAYRLGSKNIKSDVL